MMKAPASDEKEADTVKDVTPPESQQEQFHDEDEDSIFSPSANRIIGGAVLSGRSSYYADDLNNAAVGKSPDKKSMLRTSSLFSAYDTNGEEDDNEEEVDAATYNPPSVDEKYKADQLSNTIPKSNETNVTNTPTSTMDDKKEEEKTEAFVDHDNKNNATTDDEDEKSLNIGMLESPSSFQDEDCSEELDDEDRALYKAVQQQRTLDQAAFERNAAVDESAFVRMRRRNSTGDVGGITRHISDETKNVIPDFNALRSFPDNYDATRSSLGGAQQKNNNDNNINRTPSPANETISSFTTSDSDKTFRTINAIHPSMGTTKNNNNSIDLNNAYSSSSSSESSFAPSELSNVAPVASNAAAAAANMPRALKKFRNKLLKRNNNKSNIDGVFKDTTTSTSCFNVMNRRMRCYALLGLLVICGSVMVTIGIMTGEIDRIERTAALIFFGKKGDTILSSVDTNDDGKIWSIRGGGNEKKKDHDIITIPSMNNAPLPPDGGEVIIALPAKDKHTPTTLEEKKRTYPKRYAHWAEKKRLKEEQEKLLLLEEEEGTNSGDDGDGVTEDTKNDDETKEKGDDLKSSSSNQKKKRKQKQI